MVESLDGPKGCPEGVLMLLIMLFQRYILLEVYKGRTLKAQVFQK